MARIVNPIQNGKPKLVRIIRKKFIAGVCPGISYKLGCSLFIVRAISVIIGFMGIGVLAYLFLWMLMPITKETPIDYDDRTS
jgi:phage shock protein PspC (stress-responsive transcriptional regulator)